MLYVVLVPPDVRIEHLERTAVLKQAHVNMPTHVWEIPVCVTRSAKRQPANVPQVCISVPLSMSRVSLVIILELFVSFLKSPVILIIIFELFLCILFQKSC